jgi:hypothetical protein
VQRVHDLTRISRPVLKELLEWLLANTVTKSKRGIVSAADQLTARKGLAESLECSSGGERSWWKCVMRVQVERV